MTIDHNLNGWMFLQTLLHIQSVCIVINHTVRGYSLPSGGPVSFWPNSADFFSSSGSSAQRYITRHRNTKFLVVLCLSSLAVVGYFCPNRHIGLIQIYRCWLIEMNTSSKPYAARLSPHLICLSISIVFWESQNEPWKKTQKMSVSHRRPHETILNQADSGVLALVPLKLIDIDP